MSADQKRWTEDSPSNTWQAAALRRTAFETISDESSKALLDGTVSSTHRTFSLPRIGTSTPSGEFIALGSWIELEGLGFWFLRGFTSEECSSGSRPAGSNRNGSRNRCYRTNGSGAKFKSARPAGSYTEINVTLNVIISSKTRPGGSDRDGSSFRKEHLEGI